MKGADIKRPCWLWAIIFFHSIAHSSSVAPSIPDIYATSYADTDTSEKLMMEPITHCPTKCLCENNMHKILVDCSNRQLDTIPDEIPFSTYNLQIFKNSMTFLTYNNSLLNLEVLNVSNNDIVNLNITWLRSLANLNALDISKNNLQNRQMENIFNDLPLHYLNISYNFLNTITSNMFKSLKYLIELDLSKNDIQFIDYDTFSSLINLEKLHLSHNKLVSVKHEWFQTLKTLKVLCLNHNNLQTLSNVVFSPLDNLEQLDISENGIRSLGLLTFKGLSNLKILNISNNKISMLPEGIFRSLEEIIVIDLSRNPLQVFDRAFKHVTSLKTLYLKSLGNFTSLTTSSLTGLSNVEIIDFSGSKQLSDIDKYSFSSTKRLRTLDISNANISLLKRGVFKELFNLELVNLKGNPWECNCHLYWILLWLGENANTHLLLPSETVCKFPKKLDGHVLLDALDHDIVCTNASIHKYTKHALFRVGSTALLQCQASGSPLPVVTWITPWQFTFQWVGNKNSSLNQKNVDGPSEIGSSSEQYDQERERFLLMQNGDLLIRNVERGDGGFYTCVASNPLSNHSVSIRLMLDYEYLSHIKIVSILVGLATSFGFLLFTLFFVLIKMILRRCGIRCRLQNGKSSPKSQQIKKILESMEHYKKQQLERLRDNYNFQVQRIKDNCMQQMERLRESYSSQAERLRDIRDYGTLQIDRIRENYYSQVQRVRDYSTSQIERLRENYLFQRSRIRKFSAHHLYKLRENYKLQQQHLNKILENLNIESCRNVCQRTDSIVFEPDITLENVFVPKICLSQSFSKHTCDSVDNSSQISAYFTPEEASSDLSEQESDGQMSPITHKHNRSISSLHINDEIAFAGKPEYSENPNSDAEVQPSVVIFSKSDLHIITNETIV